MANEYKQVQTCAVHGFALPPDGRCVRCRNDAARAEHRSRLVRLAAGGVLALALVGSTTTWAVARGGRVAPPPRHDELSYISTDPPMRERSVATRDPSPPAAAPLPPVSPSTHAVLDAWQVELARAEAARAAEVAAEAVAQAAAEKQRIADALVVPPESPVTVASVPSRYVGRAGSPPSYEDHPSWWQNRPVTRRRGSCGCPMAARAAAQASPTSVTATNGSADFD